MLLYVLSEETYFNTLNIIITDVQEYLGSYVVDEKGVFVFQEGVLPMAMRNGFWIILDELNLGNFETGKKIATFLVKTRFFSIFLLFGLT